MSRHFFNTSSDAPFAKPRFALSAAAQLISAHARALRPCTGVAEFMCKHNIPAPLCMAELFLQKGL